MDVNYAEINSSYGHDAFLIEHGQMNHIVTTNLSQVTARDVLQTNVPVIDMNSTIKDMNSTIY